MYVAAALACAALDPALVENVLASAAGIVLECLPYLCASALLAPLLGKRAHVLLAYAGCGCGTAGARSIPAALAAAWLFGPWIAIARLAAASLVAFRRDDGPHVHRISLAGGVVGLAPHAALAAIATLAVPDLLHVPTQAPLVQIALGCAFGLFASPCALGGVALAASMHVHAPLAAYAVLATAGVVHLPLKQSHVEHSREDPRAYLLLACAGALVAFQGGGGFVHPKLGAALLACVPVCAHAAWKSRTSRSTLAVAIAFALLLVVVVGAPRPSYRATETTLSDAFAGEAIDFTGQYVRDGLNAAIERDAITCCRADAAPVSLSLAAPLNARPGDWLRVTGTLVQSNDGLVLRVRNLARIAPPSDPFIYR
jgi:hypothetical protein